MTTQSLPVRILAASLPLVLIAIVSGAIGFSTASPGTAPIPPLAAEPDTRTGARGEVTDVTGDRLTLVTEAGATLTFTLPSDAPVETLVAIDLAAIAVGDWLQGGAIPHPDTLLALVSLILLPEPVTP